MARHKKFYLKDAHDAVDAAKSILADQDLTDIQAFRAAANQCQQAMANLWQLIGIVEHEAES